MFPSHTFHFTFRIEVMKPGLVYSYKSSNKVVRIYIKQTEKTGGCYSAIRLLKGRNPLGELVGN